MEIHLLCFSKKGMSARQLHRMLGVTYKRALWLFYGGLSRNVSVSIDGLNRSNRRRKDYRLDRLLRRAELMARRFRYEL